MQARDDQFKVDEPGRYLLRDGMQGLVLRRVESYDPFLEWEGELIVKDKRLSYAWATDGRAYGDKPNWPNDIIAYLGPLEEERTPAEPAISDAAWKAYDANVDRGVCERFYAKHGIVWRTCEEWEEHQGDVISGTVHRSMQAGYVERLQEADKELDAALAEIDRLKLEIDKLEKSRNHCEFCDAIIAMGKPVLPRIPLTTPAIERYTTPMLGTQR